MDREKVDALLNTYKSSRKSIETGLKILKDRKKTEDKMALYEPVWELLERILSNFYVNRKQLAQFFEVHPSTIDAWLEKSEKAKNAFQNMKMNLDGQVISALHKAAVGFEKKVERVTKTGEVVQVVEEVGPDVRAAIHWLEKRQKEDWGKEKEEVVHNHTGTVGVVPVITMGGEKVIEIINKPIELPDKSS